MRIKLPLLGLAALALGGCFLFPTPKPASGPASYGSPYAGMADKTVAIVVYVPTATIDEYPGAREEICSFVTTQMREHMPTTRIIDPRDILDWQDKTLNWRNLSGEEIGRHFAADRVLCIQVLNYSTRKVIGLSEMQGRLRAQCRIFEIQPAPDAAVATNAPFTPYAVPRPVWTSLVDAFWPASGPLDPTQTNEGAARLRTLDSFADRLVRYFYDSQPNSAISG